MGRELQEDGSYIETTPGMRWRRPRPEPKAQRLAAEKETTDEPTVANPAPPPAIPFPEQPRARVHSRSPRGAPYLPGEGPPTDV